MSQQLYSGDIIQLAEENGCFSLSFNNTEKDVGSAFKSIGVDAWIGSVMPLIQKGVSFEEIKGLVAHGVYDMHRDAVADGHMPGPSPQYAPAGYKQVK